MAGIDLLAFGRNGERARDRYSGVPERVMVECGPLTMMYDPLEFYVGSRQIALSPLEGAILELLIRHGRASSRALEELFEREGASFRTLDVHVYRIRRKFLAAGAFDPIETVRGWGLKLRVAANAMQPVVSAAPGAVRM